MLDFGFYNMDCMEGMKEFPDNYFDLAIVDPPYGNGLGDGGGCKGWFTKYHQNDIGYKGTDGTRFGGRFERYANNNGFANETRFGGGRGGRFDKYKRPVARTGGENKKWKQYGKRIIEWDNAPSKEYFQELFRISKNQIIWGGNYFSLPANRCFLVWIKTNIPETFTMSMAEYAWTSFNQNAKVFSHTSIGDKWRFHPTQKPVELYKWILTNYAKQGDKILDTHVGSASSLIACYDLGFDYVGFEIDEEYYNKAKQRLEEEMAQIRWRV